MLRVGDAIAAVCLAVGSTGHVRHSLAASQLKYRAEPCACCIARRRGAAIAGVVYQAILRNPLADPYLLGVSSGAARRIVPLAIRIGRDGGLGDLWRTDASRRFAFGGAIIAVAFVFALAGRGGRLEPLTLLLVGVIVNAVNASILSAAQCDQPASVPAREVRSIFSSAAFKRTRLNQNLAAAGCVFAGYCDLCFT